MRSRHYKRRRPVESGEFLWLTSLSDLMILLFIFFVLMFSFTHKRLKQVDVEKIMATLRNEPPPPHPMEGIRKQMATWAKNQNLTEQIDIREEEDSVVIEVRDKVLFSSGAWALNADGAARMRSLTPTLESIPSRYQIGIEGHTDDVPIHTEGIQDNWDLSSKRALSVLQSLGLSEASKKRVVVLALGDTRPLLPNRRSDGSSIPENQSKNRRVTFRILDLGK